MEHPPPSSILYQSPDKTVILVDIPTSIASAQTLSPLQQQALTSLNLLNSRTVSPTGGKDNNNILDKEQRYKKPYASSAVVQQQRILLSSRPRQTPFPAPPSPKSDTALERVLERIPVSERRYYDAIGEVVKKGLKEIRSHYQQINREAETTTTCTAEWCLSRHCDVVEEEDDENLSSFPHDVHGRKRKAGQELQEIFDNDDDGHIAHVHDIEQPPPVILSPNCPNVFESFLSIRNAVVRNQSCLPTTLTILRDRSLAATAIFNVPPKSNFLLCSLPLQTYQQQQQQQHKLKKSLHMDTPRPIPILETDKKFNLIILDPPWPNKSARRSRSYCTFSYTNIDVLTQYLRDVLYAHLERSRSNIGTATTTEPISYASPENMSIGAIWVTNSEKARKAAFTALDDAGLDICEEWIWVKTTVHGEPVTPIDGLWRKPYEVLVIGRMRESQFETHTTTSYSSKSYNPTRRVIAAVPDIHSRKPNLREMFENIFFAGPCRRESLRSDHDSMVVAAGYSALEVFARNLTAGWWACGDEVVRFNYSDWWLSECIS